MTFNNQLVENMNDESYLCLATVILENMGGNY